MSEKTKITEEAQKPARPRMPVESYAKSLCILVICVAFHWFVAAYSRNTQFLKDLAHRVSTWNWSQSWALPIASVVVYFVVVIWHLYFRSKESKKKASDTIGKPGSLVSHALILWNAGLTSFSMLMFAGLATGIAKTIQKYGWKQWVCDGSITWEGEPDVVLYSHLFCISKFPELIDTAFLVIKGKHVLFLHWYHHISVLLYCWFVTQERYPATNFACMNAFVHSVMYYYYFRMAQGVKPAFDKMVTVIQLVQMAMGMLFTVVFMYLHNVSPKTCNGGRVVHERDVLSTCWSATGAMYFSYFVLFAILYIKRYCTKRDKSAAGHEE